MGAILSISQFNGNKPTLLSKFLHSFIENIGKLTGKVRAEKNAGSDDLNCSTDSETAVKPCRKITAVFRNSYGELQESHLKVVDKDGYFEGWENFRIKIYTSPPK